MPRSIRLLVVLAFLGYPAAALASPFTVTVTGTIQAAPGPTDTALLFGANINTLWGQTYTETITTDPAFDSQIIDTSTYHAAYGGGQYGTAAPYTLTITVNGTTFSQTEADPFWNRTGLLAVTGPNFQNEIDQEVKSSGCVSGYGFCVTSYINAYSLSTTFLHNLNFNQSRTVSGDELDPGSSFLFTFRDGPTAEGSLDQFTELHGSISSVTINHVPEPGTLLLLLTGLAPLALRGRSTLRRRPRVGVD